MPASCVRRWLEASSFLLQRKTNEEFSVPSEGLLGVYCWGLKACQEVLGLPTQGSCKLSNETAVYLGVLEFALTEAGLSWEDARVREGLCPENWLPPGSAALPGLPAALLEIFVCIMAEVQGHSGSTGFLQAFTSTFIQPSFSVTHPHIRKG